MQRPPRPKKSNSSTRNRTGIITSIIGNEQKKIAENPDFTDPWAHDFTDSNFDANSQLPYNPGGGSNWFTKIFNPPNQQAIQANNNYLIAKNLGLLGNEQSLALTRGQGEIDNEQTLALEAAKRDVENTNIARSVAPYLPTDSPALGSGGPLPLNELGSNINAMYGPEIKKSGAALAIPGVQADLANLRILQQLQATAPYQRAYELNQMHKLTPPMTVGNSIIDRATGQVFEGGGEDINTKEVYPHIKTPQGVQEIGSSQYVTEKKARPMRVSTLNSFQGGNGNGDSIYNPSPNPTAPKAAVQPPTPHNEAVTSPYGQPSYRQDENGYIITDDVPSVMSPDLWETLRRYRIMHPQQQTR